MVTKGWFRVSIGVILLSASMVSIFFNRSMNSRRSAFSTNMSLPSKSVVMFTWREMGTGYQNPTVPPLPPGRPYSLPGTPAPSQSPYPSPAVGCHCLEVVAAPSSGKAEGGQARGRRRAAAGSRKYADVTGCALLQLPSVKLKCNSHVIENNHKMERLLDTGCVTMWMILLN